MLLLILLLLSLLFLLLQPNKVLVLLEQEVFSVGLVSLLELSETLCRSFSSIDWLCLVYLNLLKRLHNGSSVFH